MKTNQLAGLANWMAAILMTNQKAVLTENVQFPFKIQHLSLSPAKTISNFIETMRLLQRI